ncbi:winged helix-turn-helix transcriptional regulator [Pseudomonas proteolytica]
MSNVEIAAALGISVKTVEWRMGKALALCMSKVRD